jgi:hypothetical protein
MKAYAYIVAGVAFIFILLVVAANAFVDPYSVMHSLAGPYYLQPNVRVPKVAFLSKNCSNFDTYLVGDSRSATLSASDLEGAGRPMLYNLATPADDIFSIVRRLSYLIENGCRISNVIINESVDVFFVDQDKKHAYSFQQSENPSISGENHLAFYSRYLLGAQALTTYLGARPWKSGPHYVYHPDGHADYLWGIKDDAAFKAHCVAPIPDAAGYKPLLAKLPGYREMARLASLNRFKLIVWVTPLNEGKREVAENPDVDAYLKELRAIPGLLLVIPEHDSPLLSDFRNWHDCGHFKANVFDQLVAPAVVRLLNP